MWSPDEGLEPSTTSWSFGRFALKGWRSTDWANRVFRYYIVNILLNIKAINKKDINNYRPISKTPCFERIISVRLWEFLKKQNIISCQSGFRQNRQTKDNIFHLTQKAEAFNRSQKLCAIFFDLAAAFDKVWHNGLTYKLIKIKCPLYLVKFFIEFLKDRKFRVRVNDFVTIEFCITTGVPQGAVLYDII